MRKRLLHPKEKLLRENRKHSLRLSELRNLSYNYPSVPLENPYQRGWKIKVALREDISKRKDAYLIEKLIRMATIDGYTRSVEVVREIRRSKNIIFFQEDDYYKYPQYPRFHLISENTINNLSIQERKYFVYYKSIGKTKFYRLYLPRYYFIYKVEKHIVTHKKLIDPLVEGEIFNLNKWFRNSYYKGCNRRSSWDKEDIRKHNIKKFGRKQEVIYKEINSLNESFNTISELEQ